MSIIKSLPIIMRDNNHEVVQVGVAFLDSYGGIAFRIALKVDNFEMLGKAIELGLVEALQVTPVASELMKQQTDQIEGTLFEAVDG